MSTDMTASWNHETVTEEAEMTAKPFTVEEVRWRMQRIAKHIDAFFPECADELRELADDLKAADKAANERCS